MPQRRVPVAWPSGRRQPAQQRQGELERGLAAELNDHPLGFLRLDHVEHVFEGERLEVETVAGVVVGRNRFRVAVHHHRGEAISPQGEGGVAAAVVELDALADAVGPAAEDHHLASALGPHLILRGQADRSACIVEALQRPFVGRVVVGGGGGEFRCAGVHGFEHRVHPEALAGAAHAQLIAAAGPGDLAVGEAQLLQLQQIRR